MHTAHARALALLALLAACAHAQSEPTLGFHVPPSVRSLTASSQAALLFAAGPGSSTAFNISLQLRPMHASGLLLSAASSDGSSGLALELLDGVLVASVFHSGARVSAAADAARSRLIRDDGSWHNATVLWSGAQGQLQLRLDGVLFTAPALPASIARPVALALTATALGDLPAGSPLAALATSLRFSSLPFYGCMRSVSYDAGASLSRADASQIGAATSADCSPLATTATSCPASDACSNNGLCSVTALGALCTCSAGHAGVNCDEGQSVELLQPQERSDLLLLRSGHSGRDSDQARERKEGGGGETDKG